MIIQFAIVLAIFTAKYVDTRRVIIGPRPSNFKFQNNGHRPHGNYGNTGWGNNGWGNNVVVNTGWGNNPAGNNVWGNNFAGNNGWGNNAFGNSGWGNNAGGNIGWGVNNYGNNGWGNNGFNRPNIIIIRPEQFSGTTNGQVIDVNVPPPKPNNFPKEDSKPFPKPVVIPVGPIAPEPEIPVENDADSNTQSTDENVDEIEPQIVIPPVSPEEDTQSENVETPNKENENHNTNQSNDEMSGEIENTAAEEISEEQKAENFGNNSSTDENTAAEVSDNVTNENADGSATTVDEDHNSESMDENESLPNLTDILDVRFNLKTGGKNNKTKLYSEPNSNDINRRNDNICGIPGITTELGAVDKATLLPWLVTLGKEDNAAFSFLCGGTLISPDVILTSAHCFINNQIPSAAKIGEEFIMIDKIIIHENYNKSQAYNNIALVKLVRPMRSTLEACLPNRNSSSADKSGMYASALEWKINRSEELPKPAIMASKIFPNSQCVKDYENVDYTSYFPKGFDSTLLCVKLQMPFVCQGDSGIQLFSVDEENDTYTLIGTIANPETSCGGTDYPGIYTKISSFLPWIEEMSRKLAS